jgi:hypothetical protein
LTILFEGKQRLAKESGKQRTAKDNGKRRKEPESKNKRMKSWSDADEATDQ